MAPFGQLLICWAILFASVGPLTEQQQQRLAGAIDGADHREDAFLALVEHVRQWDGSVGDLPIRLNPELGSLVESPQASRGDLCRVSGILEQQERLAPPYEDVWEWFVRTPSGRPVIVYVVGKTAISPTDHRPTVDIDARFYKRIDLRARDGALRSYPAFVGAHPRLVAPVVAPSGSESDRLWFVALAVAGMMLVFVALLWRARRGAASRYGRMPSWSQRRHREASESGVDDRAGLPDDPAEALAELRRRAQAD